MFRSIDKFDTFIIFSGDGDFAPAVQYLREIGKNVVVVSRSNKLGREIVGLSPEYKPMVIFAEKIESFWK